MDRIMSFLRRAAYVVCGTKYKLKHVGLWLKLLGVYDGDNIGQHRPLTAAQSNTSPLDFVVGLFVLLGEPMVCRAVGAEERPFLLLFLKARTVGQGL